MKKGFCEIVCVVDKSGSMGPVRDDSIGGFNSFLADQKKLPGEATLSLILFDHNYRVLHDGVSLPDVPDLTTETYRPGGMTALLDAVGRAITVVGNRLADTPEEERPEKVIVAILTDGMENSSKEHNYETIKTMIEHQREKYGWEFIFLGAGPESFMDAGKIGIRAADMAAFDRTTGQGVRDGFAAYSVSAAAYRTGSGADPEWEKAQKKQDGEAQ